MRFSVGWALKRNRAVLGPGVVAIRARPEGQLVRGWSLPYSVERR